MKIVLKNRWTTIRKVADDVGVLFGSCSATLTNVLSMRRVSAKFVPNLLNFDHKGIAQELLDDINDDPDLLKRITTGNLAPCHCFLFSKLNRHRKGRIFATIGEIRTVSHKRLSELLRGLEKALTQVLFLKGIILKTA